MQKRNNITKRELSFYRALEAYDKMLSYQPHYLDPCFKMKPKKNVLTDEDEMVGRAVSGILVNEYNKQYSINCVFESIKKMTGEHDA